MNEITETECQHAYNGYPTCAYCDEELVDVLEGAKCTFCEGKGRIESYCRYPGPYESHHQFSTCPECGGMKISREAQKKFDTLLNAC